MGLLTKTKELKSTGEGKEPLPRYFLFRSLFSQFLSEVDALSGAFLVKHAGIFHFAFPVSFDAIIFNRAVFDASYNLDGDFIELSSDRMKGFLNTDSSYELGALLLNSIIVPMEDNHCVFLFLKFKDGSDFFVSQKKRDDVFSSIKDFKTKYKENETLIETCTPFFPKHLGFSFVESKLKGASIASTVANIINISFENAFKLASLNDDAENLAVFYSLVNRISILIGSSNLSVLEKDYSLKICVFSSQLLDEGIYNMVLKSVLSSIYGASLIDKLCITFDKEVASPKEEIRKWIENCYDPRLI